MTTIQASAVPLRLSDNAGVSFKDVVCLLNYDVPLETQVNQVDTWCGTASGYGNIRFNPKGSAVCEANPDNSTQVTLNEMLNWQVNKTPLLFKVEYPGSGGSAGMNFFISGSCRVTTTDFKASGPNDTIQFDFTLTGEGVVDINA
jgi:hypothetical protein